VYVMALPTVPAEAASMAQLKSRYRVVIALRPFLPDRVDQRRAQH
jgi:hypothetical protein